jgi:hypothetical protein
MSGFWEAAEVKINKFYKVVDKVGHAIAPAFLFGPLFIVIGSKTDSAFSHCGAMMTLALLAFLYSKVINQEKTIKQLQAATGSEAQVKKDS